MFCKVICLLALVNLFHSASFSASDQGIIWVEPGRRPAQNHVRERLIKSSEAYASQYNFQLKQAETASFHDTDVYFTLADPGDSVIVSQYSNKFSYLLIKWGELLRVPQVNVYFNVEIMSLRNLNGGDNFYELHSLRALMATQVFANAKLLVHNQEIANFFLKLLPKSRVHIVPHPVEFLVEIPEESKAIDYSAPFKVLYIGGEDDFSEKSNLDKFLVELSKKNQDFEVIYSPHPNINLVNESFRKRLRDFNKLAPEFQKRISVQLADTASYLDYGDRLYEEKKSNPDFMKRSKELRSDDIFASRELGSEIDYAHYSRHKLTSDYFTQVDAIIGNGSTLGEVAKKMGFRSYLNANQFLKKSVFVKQSLDLTKLRKNAEYGRAQWDTVMQESHEFYLSQLSMRSYEGYKKNPYHTLNYPTVRWLLSKPLNFLGTSSRIGYECKRALNWLAKKI